MTSKRSLRDDMRLIGSIGKSRSWVFALLSLFAFLWFGVIELISFNVIRGEYVSDPAFLKSRLIEASIDFVGISSLSYFQTCICAFLLGLTGFSFLFDSKKVDFYFAQPIKRSGRFLAIYLDGLFTYMKIMGAGMLLGSVVAVLRGGYFKGMIAAVILEYIQETIQFLSLYSVTILAVMLCGNLFAAFCSMAFFWFGEIVLRALIMALQSIYFATWHDDYDILSFAFTSPILNYINGIADNGLRELNNPTTAEVFGCFASIVPMLIINLLIAAAFFCLSFIFFDKRRAEYAGKSVALAPMEIVYKWVIALIGGVGMGLLVSGIIATDGSPTPLAPLSLFAILVGVFVVCVIAEGVFAMNVKNVFNRFWHVPVLFVLCIAGIMAFKLDITGYDAYVPNEAQVESVTLDSLDYYALQSNYDVIDGNYYYVTDSTDLMKMRDKSLVVKDKAAALELARTGLATKRADRYTDAFPGTSALIVYNMKNGKRIAREILIPYDADSALMDKILSDDDYAKGFAGIPAALPTYELCKKERNLTVNTNYSDYSGGKEIDAELFGEFMETYEADVAESFDYATIRDHFVIAMVDFSGVDENRDYATLTYPVFDNYSRTLDFLTKQGAEVQMSDFDAARDELVAAAGSVSVEMSPAMIDEHFADGTESSDISYEDTAVDYEDEDKIKEILGKVDSGIIYDQNSTLPFKDFSHYCNVTVHMDDDYYNTRIFVIHEDALPGFVKEDLNKR